MEWIKASEKLPPMETPLVLKHEDGKIMLGNFYEDDQSYRIYFQRGGTYEEYSISYHAKVNIWWLDESSKTEWVSVKDRLPDVEDYYLVCRTYGEGRKEVIRSFFRKDMNCFDDFLNNIITHWTSLLLPPTY